MNFTRWFRLVLLAGLFLTACGQKEEIIPEHKPELLSVSVSAQTLVLASGESATFTFKVKDADYSFNYDVASSACQVTLMGTGGIKPTAFSLVEIVPGDEAGSYSARVKDSGKAKVYEQEVYLAIAQTVSYNSLPSYVTSSSFRVRSEAQSAPPSQKYLETGLPVVYVNTEGGQRILSKTEYVTATLQIRGTEEFEDVENLACSVRGRGNTTWSWPKKPYLIKLDEKEHLFGMHKHKRWVLLANFMDRTLMRNQVSMKVSSFTSLAWTPGCVPMELVLNGKHMGTYLFIEQVRVDNHRVAITEMTPEDNEGEALTGGYLLESDFHYDNEVQWMDPHGGCVQFGPEGGIPFGVKFPDPGDLTAQQLAYIKQYISDTAEALYGPDFTDPEKGYAHYLDVNSFVDYWLVFEVMGNHELGNPGSVFYYKDRGGKLTAGPCWDFDWGVLSFRTSPQAKTGLLNRNAVWYKRLFDDPVFAKRVKDRFQELLPQLQTIPAYIDTCEKQLEKSAELNFKMWNPAEDASMNGGSIINGDENLTFQQAVVRLKSNYMERLKVIENNL